MENSHDKKEINENQDNDDDGEKNATKTFGKEKKNDQCAWAHT